MKCTRRRLEYGAIWTVHHAKSRQTFWPGDADRGALRTSPVLGTVSSGSRIGIVRAEAGIRVECSGFLLVAAPHIFLSKTSPMANKSHASLLAIRDRLRPFMGRK